ncbi:MAG: acyloxyacyl hydrolase [Pseudomonadota bacterium]
MAGDPSKEGGSLNPAAFGIMMGYGFNFHPGTKVDYLLVIPSLSFDVTGYLAEKQSESGFHLVVEAPFGVTTRPQGRPALGLTPLLRYTPPSSGKLSPYFEAGIGLFYTDIEVEGLEWDVNFSPQVGCGITYPISRGTSLNLAVRYHHLSNAYLASENVSIDSVFFMIGTTFHID